MTVKTLPDITPNGVATPLVVASPNVPVYARWVQVGASGPTGVGGAGNAARVGDSNVGASRGTLIPNSTPAASSPNVALPVQIGYMIQEGQGLYDLTQIYVFAPAGVTIQVTFGV